MLGLCSAVIRSFISSSHSPEMEINPPKTAFGCACGGGNSVCVCVCVCARARTYVRVCMFVCVVRAICNNGREYVTFFSFFFLHPVHRLGHMRAKRDGQTDVVGDGEVSLATWQH